MSTVAYNNLIISNDQKMTDFYLCEILDKIDGNKINYDLNVATLSDILDEASMISLFDNQKIIIGSNFNLDNMKDADVEYLNKYLDANMKSVYIILITSKVDARRSSYKVFKEHFNIIDVSNSDNEADIQKYVEQIISKNGYQMSTSNINYFLSKVGNDINNINSELDKLFIYKNEDKKIDVRDIELLIMDNIDNIVYEFTNAVIEKDYDKIVSMYNNFKIQNVAFDYLLTILANNFHQLLIIKMLNNDGKSNLEIAKFIGKKEFYVKKNLERLYQYTENDLAMYIDKLAIIDQNFKMGKSNIDELELFLLSK